MTFPEAERLYIETSAACRYLDLSDDSTVGASFNYTRDTALTDLYFDIDGESGCAAHVAAMELAKPLQEAHGAALNVGFYFFKPLTRGSHL